MSLDNLIYKHIIVLLNFLLTYNLTYLPIFVHFLFFVFVGLY